MSQMSDKKDKTSMSQKSESQRDNGTTMSFDLETTDINVQIVSLFLDIDVFRFFLELFLFYHFKPCLSLSFGQHCLNRPTFDNVCEN